MCGHDMSDHLGLVATITVGTALGFMIGATAKEYFFGGNSATTKTTKKAKKAKK